MLTLDPINRHHVYITQDGYRFTYDPQAQVWTDGDMEFPKDWVAQDMEEVMEDRAIQFETEQGFILRDIEKLNSEVL
tara:strand:- start:378 stop:608 length:231 start_codon:yes stop_codon:yes gene_type:complete